DEARVAQPELVLQVRATPATEAGKRWLEFSVADCGPGIPEDVKQQLFTPFFTTKAEGMGLGLSLCRTVIEQHGSQLLFEGNVPRAAEDIYDALGILSLDDLEQAAQTHRLLEVRGIKAKTEENILKGIAMLKRTEGRIYFPEAWILADSLLITLRSQAGVVRAEIAGSLRRASETIGDLDLLVAGDDPDALRAEFGRLPQVDDVIAQDSATTTTRVR